ncbi:MAG: hypothetical protein ABIN48_02725 [Ginsengibacter sp.]
MAETWSKREREKKKRALKKEKAERRMNRKESTESGNNPESMYAYVDEDGNLSDTPPEPLPVKKTSKNA